MREFIRENGQVIVGMAAVLVLLLAAAQAGPELYRMVMMYGQIGGA